MKSIQKKSFLGLALGFGIFTMSGSNLISKNPEETISRVLNEEESSKVYNPPFARHDFTLFKEALAFKESQGKYNIVNEFGYLGKYQFGKSTLKRLRIHDTANFLKNHALQEKAFIALCSLNKWILRNEISTYVGKTINGIFITESGILAAAHLGGAGNIQNFLRSKGTQFFSDAFGTSVRSYLTLFAAYDTTNIVAERNPSVVLN